MEMLMLASMFSLTPAERALQSVGTILGLVMWYYIIKFLIGLWGKAPEQVKTAAKAGATAQTVRLIQKWLK